MTAASIAPTAPERARPRLGAPLWSGAYDREALPEPCRADERDLPTVGDHRGYTDYPILATAEH